MIRTIKAFLITLAALHFAACTAPFEIETNDSRPVVVIYGCLTEDTVFQKVRISVSSPYFDENRNLVVSNAVVNINSSDDHTFELKEDPAEKGAYLTVQPLAAVPGVTYTLSAEVDLDGDGMIEKYSATTTMTQPVAVDSITVKLLNIMGYNYYALNLFAQDEPSEDYYLARFIINDTIETYRITDLTVFSDEGINGQYLNNVSLEYFNDLDNEFPIGDRVEIDTAFFVRPGYSITLLLSRIERGYFNFINQCQREKNGENPFFGGPPSNIETNVDHGGAGFFTAFSSTAKTAVVPRD
jgi:hypothetical protein